MTAEKQHIIIIEDEGLIAAEIKSTVEELGYHVGGIEMNGDKAIDLFARVRADLVLLDINIKGTLNGIDLAKILKEKYDTPYIFLTSFADKNTLEQCMKTFPAGYIMKPFTTNDLKVNIQLALHKHNEIKKEKEFTKERLEEKYNIRLSNQEFAVLDGFCRGLTYKEIGKKLFISVNTVKTYQKRLFQNFNVKNRHELVYKIKTP